MEFFETPLFAIYALPFLIFVSRILDVSIGTVRIIMLSKGLKRLAPLFGFFEILIWLIAIRLVMGSISNIFHYLAYASGFAAGTYVGMILEEKLSLGFVLVRIVTRTGGKHLIEELRNKKHRVIDLKAQGNDGPVNVIFTILKKQEIKWIQEIVKPYSPNAFFSVEDIRFVSDTNILRREAPMHIPFLRLRKGK